MSPRRQDPPAAVVAELAEIELPNLDGDPVRLGDLWEERPAALIFLRHYG